MEKGTATANPLAAEKLSFIDRSSFPTWSLDGERLAYKLASPERIERIKIISMKTGGTRLVEPRLNYLGSFRWSPDGQFFIAAAQQEPGRLGIYRIDSQSGDVMTVVEPSDRAPVPGQPRWSPDGRGIFYVRGSGINYRDLQTQNDREILAPADSPFDGRYVTMFDVSPDGRQLAAFGREQGIRAFSIRLVPAEGGSSRELHRFEDGEYTRGSVVWTADGRSVLFMRTGGDESKAGLWRLSVDGGEPSRIDLAGVNGMRDLAIHPNGNQIAFVTRKNQRCEVWAMEHFLPPLTDLEPTPITASALGAKPARE